MFYRGRVKPSKSASLLGMIVGGVFVIIGITTVLPMAGIFGIVWTLAALGITIGHGFNFFGKRGTSAWEVEMQTPETQITNDFETKLRKLQKLKQDGILTDEEYLKKHNEILNEKW